MTDESGSVGSGDGLQPEDDGAVPPNSGDAAGCEEAAAAGAAGPETPVEESSPKDSAPSTASNRFVTDYVPPPPIPQFKNRRRLTPEEAEAQRKRRAIRRRRRRTGGLILAGFGVVILLAAGWVGWRTYQAYNHLQEASRQVAVLQGQIKDVTAVDLKAADATVAKLQDESSKAESAVSDPLYRVAAKLPWVGPNLRAVSEVTGTVQSLSTDVVPSLIQIAQTLKPSALAPKNGVIDLAPIEAASPLLQKADSAVNSSRIRLANIDRSKVIESVNDAVLTLWRKLDDAASVTSAGARVARLLPPMLGSGGTRTYLVVFQNLAESRATGGIFGNYAAIRVDHGKISIVDQGAGSRDLGTFDPPAVQLGTAATNLYGTLLGTYPQDVNLTPDFPTAAGAFAKMYATRKHVIVDGVIATDPVALSYALKGVGSVDVGDGVSLNSKNIVPILLSTAYKKFQTDASQANRDAFLAHATTVTFGAITSGKGDAGVILNGLKQAARERRVLIWSANSAEQTDIEQTALAGRLSTSLTSPSIGVFLNDGTAAKLDYYVSTGVKVTAGECQPDGRRQLKVTVTITSNAPKSGLPNYVLGTSAIGRSYGVQTNVLVFAPSGGGVVSATQDGKPTGIHRGAERGREVGELTVKLSPGATTSFEMTVLAPVATDGVGQVVSPSLVLTPGVHSWKSSIEAFPACGT